MSERNCSIGLLCGVKVSQPEPLPPALAFFLPIVPTAQQRPRHAHNGNFSRTYKSKTQEDNERTLEALLMQHRPETPITAPVRLSVVATFPIPATWPKKRKQAALRGELNHVTKPDLDNLMKQIKDCITRLRFWEDDKQVCQYGHCVKKYSDNPGWSVIIQPLEQWP